MWHWAEPGDARVPWHDAACIPLGSEVMSLKRAAVARFVSQVEPLGPDEVDRAVLPP
ncbi:hypothetical protein ACIRQP_31920 [Streptomyces sp. NPDC102274]|uniref:hypothetical protein n=1 Tax=Streptomyces sp. NPDC102274 TaxID=3366151 RepID=UPI00382559F6